MPIKELPDKETMKRNDADYAPSLFALLNSFIEKGEVILDEFHWKDDQAVYSFCFYCRGDASWYENDGRIYSDLGQMKEETGKDFDLDILCIEYKKRCLSSSRKEINITTEKMET